MIHTILFRVGGGADMVIPRDVGDIYRRDGSGWRSKLREDHLLCVGTGELLERPSRCKRTRGTAHLSVLQVYGVSDI